MKVLKTHKTFEGLTQFWEHDSRETKTLMKFSTFTPPGPVRGAIIWLSGLTCTDENFITKAGAQKYLADAGLAVVCPDTSPRGLNLPGEHDAYDFGSGAGFYVNATTPDYKTNYRMYSYIADELYHIVQSQFKVDGRISISGHSMGGHGAMIIGLREKGKFKSISAFAPIVNPSQCPWGQKAFTGYFGDDHSAWKNYDSCELVKAGINHERPILIDQGLDDQFFEKELLTDNFVKGCAGQKQKADVHYRAGYDHSYYFISTFIENHIRFHAEWLR